MMMMIASTARQVKHKHESSKYESRNPNRPERPQASPGLVSVSRLRQQTHSDKLVIRQFKVCMWTQVHYKHSGTDVFHRCELSKSKVFTEAKLCDWLVESLRLRSSEASMKLIKWLKWVQKPHRYVLFVLQQQVSLLKSQHNGVTKLTNVVRATEFVTLLICSQKTWS